MNVQDFIFGWKWIKEQLLTNFKPPDAKQPKLISGLPCPKLESVTYYPIGQVGEAFPIIISACNFGAHADAGGVTISFPAITKNSQGGFVEVESATSTGMAISRREEGDELLSSDVSLGQKFVAQYLTREIEVSPWKQNEEIAFRLKVTPVKEGQLSFYVTVWAATNGWKKIIRSPIAKDVIDHQGHAVYPLVVNVRSTK